MKRIIVSGGVQGVGYRWFCKRNAQELGISGHARNLSDGTVEVIASGARMEDFIARLRRGPPHATVKDVFVEEYDAPIGKGFSTD